jgi:hypothetical protein
VIHHADIAIAVTQRIEVDTSAQPADGHGPLSGRLIALGWWVDSDAPSVAGHEPTGTLYLIADERRSRPMWVRQSDLTALRMID